MTNQAMIETMALRDVARPRLPAVPWRDPHSVSNERLSGYIDFLERESERNPESVDLRVCLGMAYAMDYRVYKSMDALEHAVAVNPFHFFARLKYAELLYRLRILRDAEKETLHALELAGEFWELTMARKQLQQIREKMREGTQRPAWSESLSVPALLLSAGILLVFLVMWK